MSRPSWQKRSLKYLCDQVIHSYFFSTWLNPDRKLRGVFFCSDRLKDREIYRLELTTIIDLFEAVGTSRRTLGSLRHFAPDNNRLIL